MFEKVSRSLKYDSNIFSTTDIYIYIWTPRSITLPRSRCACGVIRKYCVGTEPSALLYILVTSTTIGHDGSVVSALASQAKGRISVDEVCLGFIQAQSRKLFQASLFADKTV